VCRLTEQGPTSFAAPEPGTTPPKCRECAHPPAEGRRSCPGHLGRERARKLRKKELLHPKQNHPKLHLLPTDQLKLQPGVFALERRLTLLSTSRSIGDRYAANRASVFHPVVLHSIFVVFAFRLSSVALLWLVISLLHFLWLWYITGSGLGSIDSGF